MKKIFIAVLILISTQSFGQNKLYAIRCNTNGTIDSFYVKFATDSLFDKNNVFVQFSKEHFDGQYSPAYPNGFENYTQRADAVWVSNNCLVKNTTIIPTPVQSAIDGKASLVHTHTVNQLSNASTVGINLLGITTPATASLIRINSNGSAVTRTVTESRQDLSIDQMDNTSDINKPISTATQAALNNKSSVYVGVDAGANDSYTITASPAPSSYTTGMIVIFKANTSNTTACSINVNGLGVKTIVKRVNTTPATGDILALMWCQLVYDGTNFVLLNPIVN